LISDSLVPFSGDGYFSPLSVVIFGWAEFLGFLSYGACAVRGREEDRFEDDFLKKIIRTGLFGTLIIRS
jgi:hypothetical protein